MQLTSDISYFFKQLVLDVHMNIFEFSFEFKLSPFNIITNSYKSCDYKISIWLRYDALPG